MIHDFAMIGCGEQPTDQEDAFKAVLPVDWLTLVFQRGYLLVS